MAFLISESDMYSSMPYNDLLYGFPCNKVYYCKLVQVEPGILLDVAFYPLSAIFGQ